jgi:GH3 auxin-responsive promoter
MASVRSFLSGLRPSLFDNPLLRRVMHTLQAASNRRLLARFDRGDAGRRQTRTLLTLIHQARLTPFGRDHDFGRIRTPLDFRRLVPLQRLAPRTDFALRSHRQTLGVALALTQQARPHSICWLGDEPLAAERFPLLVRPSVFGANTLPGGPSPTCLIGTADRIVAFTRDRRHLLPDVRAAVYSRVGPPASFEALRQAVGPIPMLLELLTRPEGPIAIEDPRFGALRLLVDAGVYFEFIPATGVDEATPPRLGLDEVRLGVPYELALTAPTGVWAGRAGVAVVFDRLDPPLLRVLTPPDPAVAAKVGAETVPALHRSSTGIPAAPRGTFAHTPWSAPADRG